MKRLSLLLLVHLGAIGVAGAQSAQPFDMSGERPDQGGFAVPAAPAPLSPRPAPVAQPDNSGFAAPASPPVTRQASPPAAVTPPAAPANPAPATLRPARPAAATPPIDALTVPSAEEQPDLAEQPATAAPQPAAAQAPQDQGPAPQNAATQPAPPVVADAVSAPGRRFIIPSHSLRLEGETDQKTWAIFLTAGQVAQPARLDVSYKNAVVVMPEGSRLWVSVNNQPVMEIPLASSEAPRTVTVQIPVGLLQAGSNTIRFMAAQRHRTDCSIQSTYELWTEVDTAGTALTFPVDTSGPVIRSLDDLAAIGYDARGVTTIHVIAPSASQPIIGPYLLKLVQAITLFGNYPTPKVTVSESSGATDGTGTLTVLLGTAGEIGGVLSQSLPQAGSRPSVSFVDDRKLGSAVMVVSGPSWSQIGAAIDAIGSRIDRPAGVARKSLSTSTWLAPDVRYFMEQAQVPLSELGFSTQEFSGRRFRTSFAVGMPADFYAEAYGQATILLDAAYSAAVLPSSHIDLYVNGQIAATARIATNGGAIYRHFPIQIPLRHFHPGVNQISIETSIDTVQDRACAPGGSVAGGNRFALFDTTEFRIPDFARIAKLPNLAALSGIGFPYAWSPDPTALVLGRSDADTYAAAATFLARLALQAGRILPLTPSAASAVGDRSAIFIGAASQLPGSALAQLGIAEDAQTAWRDDTRPLVTPTVIAVGAVPLDPAFAGNSAVAGDVPGANGEDTNATFDRWRTDLAGGGGWRGQLSSFQDWLQRTFDLSFATFRIGHQAEAAFEPPRRTTLVVAQAASPSGEGTWTVVTAPSESSLVSGIASLVDMDRWTAVDGHLTAYSATTDKIEVQPTVNYTFVQTRAFSLGNLRLVAANWLSTNILFYAFGLVALCGMLGLVTTGLLFRLGRPS